MWPEAAASEVIALNSVWLCWGVYCITAGIDFRGIKLQVSCSTLQQQRIPHNNCLSLCCFWPLKHSANSTIFCVVLSALSIKSNVSNEDQHKLLNICCMRTSNSMREKSAKTINFCQLWQFMVKLWYVAQRDICFKKTLQLGGCCPNWQLKRLHDSCYFFGTAYSSLCIKYYQVSDK